MKVPPPIIPAEYRDYRRADLVESIADELDMGDRCYTVDSQDARLNMLGLIKIHKEIVE